MVTPQTPPHKLRSGFLLATLPLFIFQRTRHPCRSQAANLFGPRDQRRTVGNTGLPGRSSPPFIRPYTPGFARRATPGRLPSPPMRRTKPGGADGIRTHDLLVANQALSQLSYGPRIQMRNSEFGVRSERRPTAAVCRSLRIPHSPLRIKNWWAQVESNHRPRPYQGRALAN